EQPLRGEAARREAHAGAGKFDTPGRLRLVAPKGHDYDRDLGRKRLLSDSKAAVADHARGAAQDGIVGDEAHYLALAHSGEVGRVVGRGRAEYRDAGRRQGFERHVQQALVALALGRAGDKHQRVGQLVKPRGRVGGWPESRGLLKRGSVSGVIVRGAFERWT